MSKMPLHVAPLAQNNMTNRAFGYPKMGGHVVVSRVAVFE